MANSADMSKEERIKKEYNKLRRTFRDLDENMKKTVDSLLKNAAFMTVTLEDIQTEINRDGVKSEYDNGGGQKGFKQSDAVKTHISMTRNHATIMKQLTDLVPPVRKKKSALQELRGE